ncbi:MAG: lipoyl(octanoyl) transferase LipB [Chitinophagaceae bacterium]
MILPFIVIEKGIIHYQDAWTLQEQLFQQNIQCKLQGKETQHYFILCQHPPVYTLGRNGKIEHLLLSEKKIQQQGIKLVHTNRGGDITFHGIGQIVGYPIFDLEKINTDLSLYLRNLEAVIIKTIAHYNIKGNSSIGETGVWIDPHLPHKARKICAIGIRCSRWITMHGFALNANVDLGYFKHIIPCGIQHKKVASMKQELGKEIPLIEVQSFIIRYMQNIFFS